MRVGRWGGAVHGVAAGVRAHVHDAHAIRVATVDRLQVAVVEGVLPHHGAQGVDDFLVGDLAALGQALGCVVVVLAAQPHDGVGDGPGEPLVFLLAAGLERLEPGHAVVFQLGGRLTQACGFLVEDRPHVGLGDGGAGAEHALFAAASTGPVAADECLVVAPHHEVVAQGGLAGVLRRVVVVQAKEFLARVRQQPAEDLRGGQFGVEFRRFAGHAQRVVVAADLHAFAAALAEVADEYGEDTAVAGFLFLNTAKDRGDVIVREGQLVNDVGELAACLLGDGGELIDLGTEDVLERLLALVGDVFDHPGTAAFLESLHLVEQILLLLFVADVVSDSGDEDGADVLRGVGQGGVRAGGDALHALGAILGNINRRLAAGDVFALRRADTRTHQAHAGQRAGRLVVAQVIAELGVELGHGLERRALLSLRHGAAWAAGAFAAGGGCHFDSAGVVRREQRVAHGRRVGVLDPADVDFLHALEAAEHHLHVRLDNGIAEAAKLLLVLLVHDVVVLLLVDFVILEERGHLEKRAEERVALHAKLQILPVGGLTCDIKAGQDENPDVVLLDELPVLGRDALPCLLGGVARFPDE